MQTAKDLLAHFTASDSRRTALNRRVFGGRPHRWQIAGLAGAGHLHGGKQLRKIAYRVETGAGCATATVDEKTLRFEEIVIDQ